MRILKPSDIRKDIVAFFRSESLVPIVGAGLSCNVPTLRGKVPSGTTYKEHMLQALLKNSQFTPEEHDQLKSEKFSTLCDYYEDDENVSAEERLSYLKENFFNAKFDAMDMRRKFFEIQWPYIYSLNIDDAIENSSQYNTIILPNREFRDDLFTEERCLIKLHGDIREIVSYKQSDKIFTSKEYALSLNKNTPLLNKLKNDYANQNILFVGCSLDDEVDLKTLKDASVDFQLKDTLSKTIIFTKGVPGKLQKSKFKTYGITDVVCFETFDSIYKFLYEVWEESTSIPNDELSNYCNVAMRTLKVSDKEKNQNYFFWGKSLFDPGKSELCYPYYFISRDVTADISKSMIENQNETSPNERLMISIAHVQYTIATILSDLSRINEFTDEVLLKESIDAVYEALKSPYNDDDYLRERKQRASRGVVNFLKYFTTNTGRMKEYPDYHQKVSDLVNIYLTGKQLKSRS